MHRDAIGILLLLVGQTLQQSGDSPYEDEEVEAETNVDFSCFTKLYISKSSFLICNLTTQKSHNSWQYQFRVCQVFDCANKTECNNTKKEKGRYSVLSPQEIYNVCLKKAGMNDSCRCFQAKDIVQPDVPTNLKVIYDKPEREYRISYEYENPEYLENNVIFQISLHKENEDWPECDTSPSAINTNTGLKCTKTAQNALNIPEGKLEPSATYEARVRVQPYGDYFSGPWSSWSGTARLNTTFINSPDTGENTLVITLAIISFILCLAGIFIITLCWKSRIKPIVWPEIPNHKNTLEKLCKKPQELHHISFNPSLFEDILINKVDDIKAKEHKEDCFSVSHEVNNKTCAKQGGSGEENHILLDEHGRLPCVDIEALSHFENQSFLPNSLVNGMHISCLQSIPIVTQNVPSHSCGGSSVNKNEPSNPSTIFSFGLPHYSNEEKPTMITIKPLRHEEAYISMAAFKTPGSTVN
ncbi:hypothetical protein XENTR_v10003023 [Xenopus tropicalis]|uniref:Interleukin 7 receptor n=1 Tax=Xenopus tropicalis TaxID=8364 RepID=A0A803JHA3_XENTR|nr:interleukin-7 receptor subunit alpha [Xenopus tropicalis]KAE8636515.1 hypothetical protein XENTR_v10003023 [Xenopus tropicalis]URX48439.1 interleukin-7 receptor alpha [Xenopus tropicalis]